jgi:hypothetical protein
MGLMKQIKVWPKFDLNIVGVAALMAWFGLLLGNDLVAGYQLYTGTTACGGHIFIEPDSTGVVVALVMALVMAVILARLTIIVRSPSRRAKFDNLKYLVLGGAALFATMMLVDIHFIANALCGV